MGNRFPMEVCAFNKEPIDIYGFACYIIGVLKPPFTPLN